MNIGIYSLTRDRLDYSKICFESLRKNAGADYYHLVVDNGSEDGTVEWLKEEYKPDALITNNKNLGISTASNQALDFLTNLDYLDIICKVDNDSLVLSEDILVQIRELLPHKQFNSEFILSPYVKGIVNQPHRGRYITIKERKIGLTAIVGGLFHCVPTVVYKEYRYPTTLPLAWGQDDHFCKWFKDNGGNVGYVEDLYVEHYRGTNQQALDYPDYFQRKFKEEKSVAVCS